MSETLKKFTIGVTVEGAEGMRQFSIEARNSSAATEELTAELSQLAGEGVVVNAQTVKVTASLKAQYAQLTRNKAELKNLTNTLKQQAEAVGKTAREQEHLAASYKLAGKASEEELAEVKRLIDVKHDLIDANNSLAISESNVGDSAGITANQMQQVSWQMQDVIVMAQMGSNAATIFTQQGTQLASAFSPLAGLFVGIAGGIWGMVAAMNGADQAFEDLKQQNLDEILKPKTLKKSMKAAKEEIKDLKEELKGLSGSKYGFDISRLQSNQKSVKAIGQELTATERALWGFNKSYAEAVKTVTTADQLGMTGITVDIDSIQQANELVKAEHEKIIADNKAAAKDAETTRKAIQTEMQQSETAHAQIMTGIRTQALQELKRTDARSAENQRFAATEAKLINKRKEAEESGHNWRIEEIDIALELEKKRHASSLDRINQNIADKNKQANDKVIAQNKAHLRAQQSSIKKHHKALNKLYSADKGDNPALIQAQAYQDAFNQRESIMDRASSDFEAGLFDEEELRARHLQAVNGYNAALVQSDKDRAEAQAALSELALSSAISQGASLTNTLLSAAEEGSGAYKALFAVSQAFAIADGTVKAISIAQTVKDNYVKGNVWDTMGLGAEAASAASLSIGMANVGAMAGIAFAGAFDSGGYIPNNSMGVVSEFGDELVGGTLVYNQSGSPLPVTGREQTAAMMGGNKTGQSGGQQVNQYFTISGNGDRALEAAMKQAAKAGAQEGYNMVSKDFRNDRGISKQAGRRR